MASLTAGMCRLIIAFDVLILKLGFSRCGSYYMYCHYSPNSIPLLIEPYYCIFGNRFALRMTSVSVMMAGEQPTVLLNST